MERLDSVIAAINKRVAGSLGTVAAVMLGVWGFVMAAAIVGRMAFGVSWLFVEEYTAYFMLLSGCLGLAYAARLGAHVKVTVVVERLPKRARLVLECITMAVCVWWTILLTKLMNDWFLGSVASGRGSIETNTPQWIPNLLVVISCAGLALATLAIFLHLITQAIHWRSRGGELER